MSGMTDSAQVRRINEQCSGCQNTAPLEQAIALLKRANRYVGVHPSIGGQALGVEITEFIAAQNRRRSNHE